MIERGVNRPSQLRLFSGSAIAGSKLCVQRVLTSRMIRASPSSVMHTISGTHWFVYVFVSCFERACEYAKSGRRVTEKKKRREGERRNVMFVCRCGGGSKDRYEFTSNAFCFAFLPYLLPSYYILTSTTHYSHTAQSQNIHIGH